MKDTEADHESLDLCVASNEPEQLMLALARAAKAAHARATNSANLDQHRQGLGDRRNPRPRRVRRAASPQRRPRPPRRGR